MKILCTADVHIGRRPSRLPDHIDCRPLSCGEAWGQIVDLAIRERVDLVAVSGDLVDSANRFYEAAGPVEAGLRRLAQAGIETVMVAGNHDYHSLPWLLERRERVRLLGRGGVWERFTLERNGTTLHVDGWSFPEGAVHASPLASYPFAADGSAVLGLLHADLDQPASRYAPVTQAELRACAPSFWLLGHVHAPRLYESPGSASLLYPGSPQSMDPGEGGAHGVWIAEFGSDRAVGCRMIPLSSVRYERIEVTLEGVLEEPEADRRVIDAVRTRLQQISEEASCVRYLSCRVRVVGRTPLRHLEERLRQACGDLNLTCGDATAFVEEVEVDTAPERDLGALAVGKDAPAVLARLLAALEAGGFGSEHEALLRDAERRVAAVYRAKPYLALERRVDKGGALSEMDVADLLREQALLLLDELLTQKEVRA